MLSPLTRGYGSWDGAHYDPYSDHATEEKLPQINEREIHRHGVTIGHMSRCSTSLSFKSNIAPPATPISRSEKLQRETTHNRLPREITSVDQTNKYDLPKTYLTKKGALMLFTAPKEEQELDEANGNPKKVKMHRVKKLLDSTLQMGSLDRLAMSILQYGDEEEYDKENTSISDEKHKLFMKILRKAENQRELDTRSQPGSDLHSYLRDLKFRARASMSGDTNIPRSREAMELRAILQGLQDDRWPIVYNTESGTYENRSNFGDQFTRPASQQSHRPQTSPGSGTATPRSILSASKLRASLKSYNTYMGRPATGVIPEEESVELGFDGEGVHIPQGIDEVDEGELDWEEKGEEAACTEVDLARYGIIGEEDNGEGDDVEESTDEIRVSPKPDSAQGKSPAPSPAQPTKTHDPTSPPKQEPDSSQIKASLSRPGSRASSKSTSPQIPRTPSPSKQLSSISQSNKKSPSPVQKTVSPSQKPDPDKSSSVEVIKPCPSPEIRGKNTPPSVTITKKQSQIQNNLLSFDAKKDTVTSPSHTVGSLSQVSTEKSQSNQEHTDIKSVKSEEVLPSVPFSSSDQKEQGAPDAQQSQIMDGGAPAQTSVTSAIEKEEKSKQEDENEESHESSVTSAEDKSKKKQLQSNDEQKEYSEIESTSKTEPEAPTRLIDQMPVIPDYLKPKPQKTPKTKEKKTKKQQPPRSKKDVTKAMSVASIQPEAEVTGKEKSAPKVWEHEKVDIPPEKEELVIPDHMKEAFSRDTEQSKTALEEQMKQMANILDDTFKVTIDEELLEVGLTEEELLEAKMEVEEKLNVAQAKINEMEKTGGADLESEETQRAEKEKAVKLKEGKAKKKGGKGGKSTPKDTVAKVQGKSDKELEKQKVLKKEQKRTEEKKKLEEKRKLEDQIQERQELVEEHEQRTRDKELKRGKKENKKELKLEVDRLRREELEMQEAVDEVHKYLAESRKRQREERDQRRKADQERRREHAREKFEQDKKKREEDSRKVMDELDRIHDLEMRKQKKLEEEMRREEEERLAIEQAEEEENSRVKAAEDQERRLREIELQMEEEEMQRLYLQEQEISRQRILLEMEREKMSEEEELKRQELLAEQIKLEEIKRKKEEEEQRVLDEQRRRLMELKEMEEAAKLKMQQDLEERRAKALARREENLENKSNMDKLKQSQGITKAWVFSYFVRWPLESYMVPIGGDETKKKGFRPKTNRPKTAK
ncbi:calponin homology domain-containing protein DDB_G0272472-like isoform X10 [Ostrea edulis]|uniref:calponin homology domain-containing protein DDB_G0272472-like isoform X10 n=1 Tax=Ostrea edulis TaxID=37623 RepID=UPI0024AF4E4E|nr:calponin homology domain-containing protein DDB_G0272472-like isoform X10 [Ostrea edulis]